MLVLPRLVPTKLAAEGTASAKTRWRTKNIISAGNIIVANAIAHNDGAAFGRTLRDMLLEANFSVWQDIVALKGGFTERVSAQR